jgi:hypothetical protein
MNMDAALSGVFSDSTVISKVSDLCTKILVLNELIVKSSGSEKMQYVEQRVSKLIELQRFMAEDINDAAYDIISKYQGID